MRNKQNGQELCVSRSYKGHALHPSGEFYDV